MSVPPVPRPEGDGRGHGATAGATAGSGAGSAVGRTLAAGGLGPGPGTGPAAERQRRLWRVVGPMFGAVWVVFLSEPLRQSWANDDPLLRWAGVVGVGLSAFGFVVSVFLLRASLRESVHARPWAIVSLGVQVVGVVLACLAAQEHGLVGTVFISVTGIYLIRSVRAIALTVVLGLVCYVLPRVIPGWQTEDSTIIALVLATLATFGFAQLVERNRQLQVAQEEVATLAVAQERERIARDMHDVLGHSLTVISVKAELAGRLVHLDADRAAAEVADIQALARAALADARGMVTSVRHVTLAGELAAARQAFDAAGVAAQLPGAIDTVPGHLRELFAWTVREGTTNVLRHAAATRVVVSLAPDRVVVEDDGRGPAHEPPAAGASPDDPPGSPGGVPGHGLTGLRERARAAGATVETGRSALGGFRLAVRGPLVPGARITA